VPTPSPSEQTPPSRILITGATGFVGGYLVPACRARHPRAELVALCSNPRPDLSRWDGADVRHIAADLRDADALRRGVAEARPDLIFHLAGQASVAASWRDPFATLAINAGGALRLFEALRAEELATRVVLIGSGEQYGRVRPEDNPIREDCPQQPVNPYAVSKAAQDLYGYQYFVAYALPIVRVRAFNHFGPGQSDAFVIASFARQIALIEAGKVAPELLVGNLAPRRDFLPVEDVVRAYLALAERGHPGEAYNVGSGEARSIEQVLHALLALARCPIQVRTDPARFRPTDAPLLVADVSRLRARTGWAPAIPFADALGRTLDSWRERVARE